MSLLLSCRAPASHKWNIREQFKQNRSSRCRLQQPAGCYLVILLYISICFIYNKQIKRLMLLLINHEFKQIKHCRWYRWVTNSESLSLAIIMGLFAWRNLEESVRAWTVFFHLGTVKSGWFSYQPNAAIIYNLIISIYCWWWILPHILKWIPYSIVYVCVE